MRGHIICGPFFVFRDISFPARRFVLVLWRFSGHSPFAWRFVPVLPPKQGCFVASRRFSPGIVGFFGIFPFRSDVLSRFCGAFQDIFLSRGVLSRFYRPNKDVLLLPKIFSWNCGVFRDIFLLWCAVGINKYYFAFCMWFYYFCTANFEQITKNRDNYEKENCCRQLENEYHCCRGR